MCVISNIFDKLEGVWFLVVANKSKITRLFGGKQTSGLFCLLFFVGFVLFLVPIIRVLSRTKGLLSMKISVIVLGNE